MVKTKQKTNKETWVCGRCSHSSWIICTCAHLLILYIRTRRFEQVLEDWMMHKLCERLKRALGKTSVCMCVCVRGQLWQLYWMCLCAPIPRCWHRVRGEKTRAHLTALFIYIPLPVLPISTRAFISLALTLKTIILQSSNVKRRLSLSLSSLFCVSSVHRGLLFPITILLVFPDGWVKTDRKAWRHRDRL